MTIKIKLNKSIWTVKKFYSTPHITERKQKFSLQSPSILTYLKDLCRNFGFESRPQV